MDNEITTINKYLERLRGYSCGYHKQLEKQMLNRIKLLKSLNQPDTCYCSICKEFMTKKEYMQHKCNPKKVE